MSKTKIEWTVATINPFPGCTKVSAGCRFCYAEKQAASSRLQQFEKYRHVITNGRWNGKLFIDEKAMMQPMHWKTPQKIFVNSMGDMFRPAVPFDQIDRQLAVFVLCPQHTFQILTKYEDRMLEYFTSKPLNRILPIARNMPHHPDYPSGTSPGWPIKNLWLGVTAENQEQADKRIPILLQIPAAVRFVSVEPMLEMVGMNLCNDEDLIQPDPDFPEHREDHPVGCMECQTERHWEYMFENHNCGIDWVICGCESGHNRRPMKPIWALNLYGQCKLASVPFFMKQMEIDGKVCKDITQFPKELQVREFPHERTLTITN